MRESHWSSSRVERRAGCVCARVEFVGVRIAERGMVKRDSSSEMSWKATGKVLADWSYGSGKLEGSVGRGAEHADTALESRIAVFASIGTQNFFQAHLYEKM